MTSWQGGSWLSTRVSIHHAVFRRRVSEPRRWRTSWLKTFSVASYTTCTCCCRIHTHTGAVSECSLALRLDRLFNLGFTTRIVRTVTTDEEPHCGRRNRLAPFYLPPPPCSAATIHHPTVASQLITSACDFLTGALHHAVATAANDDSVGVFVSTMSLFDD